MASKLIVKPSHFTQGEYCIHQAMEDKVLWAILTS